MPFLSVSLSMSLSVWSLRWHFTNRSVTGAPYSIKLQSVTQLDTMVKSTMTETVLPWGHGGTAAAMSPNHPHKSTKILFQKTLLVTLGLVYWCLATLLLFLGASRYCLRIRIVDGYVATFCHRATQRSVLSLTWLGTVTSNWILLTVRQLVYTQHLCHSL